MSEFVAGIAVGIMGTGLACALIVTLKSIRYERIIARLEDHVRELEQAYRDMERAVYR